MKNIIIGVLITVLIFGGALAGCGVVQDKGVEQNGELEVDYPVGDTTPEHLAEVLGSYSRYEELRDSKLRKPDLEMEIGYDTYGAEQRKVAWVFLVMQGEVVKIERKVITALSRGEVVKIEGRVITIANEGETISLYVPEFAEIEKFPTNSAWRVTKEGEVMWQGEEIGFEELKIGDWLWHIYVAINADHHPQARAINVGISP
ncbi:hypothetical protein ES705_14507 [subsurface metagenome]